MKRYVVIISKVTNPEQFEFTTREAADIKYAALVKELEVGGTVELFDMKKSGERPQASHHRMT